MAWKVRKGNRWLVRWRDAAGRTVSRMVEGEAEADRLVGLMAIEEGMRPRKPRRGLAPDVRAARYLEKRIPRRTTVAEYATKIIDHAESTDELRPNTVAMYRTAIRALGTLGKMPLDDVTAADIRGWWPTVKANRTAVRALLSKIFTHAQREGLVIGSPFKDAEIKRPKTVRDVEPLTVAQVEALAEAAGRRSARDRVMILLMAYGGFRAGEVAGLRAQDVEWDACAVNVRQVMTRRGASKPKTAAGRRRVFVECDVIAEVRALVDADGTAPDGRIFFSNGWGSKKFGPLYNERINEIVRRAGRDVGLDVHAHQLRHTAASLWITVLHADPVTVQRQLGHADVRTTLGIYGHLFEYGGRDLAEGIRSLREAHRNLLAGQQW